MVNFENVLLVISGDENIDTGDGHINSFESLVGEFDGFRIGVKEFNGATEGEVGTELIFSRNAAHSEELVTDTKDTEVVNIGNELLEEEALGFDIFLLEIGDELIKLLGII